ncbi:MAG: sodium:proton exchanger [Firmicutes bacterium]|nr:sodium:proton exchanger [Bacillota bacterium]
MIYLTLGIGLLVLVKGADAFVGAASKIAVFLNVPSFIVGIFIVAMGTSAPEAAIGVISGIQGNNIITLGDVVGSSIVNILGIIGITAIIFPFKIESVLFKKEILISIFVQVCLYIMIFTDNTLSRMEAVVLLVGLLLFFGYFYINFKNHSKKEKSVKVFAPEAFSFVETQEELLHEKPSENEGHIESMPKLLFFLFIGLAGLIGGASLAVNSAIQIAHNLGLSEAFIGVTIVALGTSLPEFSTCLVAVHKKEAAIAVGNIIGSNIFNVLFVLGMSGVLHPIEVTSDIILDLFVMIGASVLLFISIFFSGRISRKTGFVYFSAYVIYLTIKLNSLG